MQGKRRGKDERRGAEKRKTEARSGRLQRIRRIPVPRKTGVISEKGEFADLVTPELFLRLLFPSLLLFYPPSFSPLCCCTDSKSYDDALRTSFRRKSA